MHALYSCVYTNIAGYLYYHHKKAETPRCEAAPLSAAVLQQNQYADRPAKANFSKEQNKYTVHDACHHMHGHITCPKGSSRWDLTCLHSQPSPTSLWALKSKMPLELNLPFSRSSQIQNACDLHALQAHLTVCRRKRRGCRR